MEIPELNHVCYQVTNSDADTRCSYPPLVVMVDGACDVQRFTHAGASLEPLLLDNAHLNGR